MKEKIRIVEGLMRSWGHSHLILAGHPAMTSRIERALPKALRERVLDLVSVPAKATVRDVVKVTLAAFVEEEERQSLDFVQLLEREIHSNSGLAVIGVQDSLDALASGRADTLVIASDFVGHGGEVADREELVRLAEANSLHVEVVTDGRKLELLGGVGCLLRYRAPAVAVPQGG